MNRVLLVVVLAVFCWTATARGGPPNVVLILADDLGWGDLTCYASTSKIPTPHINALAAAGMRFTDAHSPSAVCTPTRYGILTGRYAWRTRMKSQVLGPYNAPLIEPGRVTLAGLLSEAGYATACIGKWHLGMRWATHEGGVLPLFWDLQYDQAQIDLAGPITEGPLTVGFDSYFGTDVPNFPPYCYVENDRVLGAVPDRPKPEAVYGRPGLIQDGWDLHDILPELRDRAVGYIETHAEREPDRPFFLYLPLTAPHTPIVPNEEFAGMSGAGDYGDLVCEVDALVGAVLAAVDRAGITGETIVIFTSDNGSPGRAGDPHLRSPEWGAGERGRAVVRPQAERAVAGDQGRHLRGRAPRAADRAVAGAGARGLGQRPSRGHDRPDGNAVRGGGGGSARGRSAGCAEHAGDAAGPRGVGARDAGDALIGRQVRDQTGRLEADRGEGLGRLDAGRGRGRCARWATLQPRSRPGGDAEPLRG
ncbi:MAG: sulfatase-like hydrolase/transferase [Planctomycetota bacterium]|nr:MAG: sulfatase-like hydrolase/transferase [Planctomycetota bacterium]